MIRNQPKAHWVTLSVLAAAVVASAPGVEDRITWWLEIAPVLAAMPFIWHYGRTGRLSPWLQAFVVAHGLILCLGGHYTYAKVPLGEWLRDWGVGERNNYDKLGHFAQGFVPALVLREIFLRIGSWRSRPVLHALITILACGGVSALYEVIEMSAALLLGQDADSFLGTQGYQWDTQTDMAVAMAGAALATATFGRAHAASIERGAAFVTTER